MHTKSILSPRTDLSAVVDLDFTPAASSSLNWKSANTAPCSKGRCRRQPSDCLGGRVEAPCANSATCGCARRGGAQVTLATGSSAGWTKVKRWTETSLAVAGYLRHFVPAVLRPHRFRIPTRQPRLIYEQRLTASQVQDWKRFYRCERPETVPFAYFTTANSRLMFAVLKALRLNLRHLLLVSHSMTFPRGEERDSGLESGARYIVRAEIEEVKVQSRDRILLTCRSKAQRKGSNVTVFETRDSFLVRNIPAAAIERLLQVHGRSVRDLAVGNRLDPALPETRRKNLQLDLRSGLSFGLLSGDLNLAHVHRTVGRLLGCGRPFAQGLLISNYVMATLVDWLGRAPKHLQIHFRRPVFLGQSVELRFSNTAFEVVDGKGSLLAAGRVTL